MSILEAFHHMSYGPAPESPAGAQAWLEAHARDFGLFIGGEWYKPAGRPRLEVRSPATDAHLAHITDANAEDVAQAYEAARRAQPGWAALSDARRAQIMYAIARGVQKHARLFAVLEALDNGKPIRESRDIDVPLAARHFYHHAGWAQIRSLEMPGMEPLGVVGQIIPWNFPLLMAAWKLAPALAMGNAVVLKPAPFTPLTALALCEVLAQAGLPPGVVNVVTGGDEAGAAITAHGSFDKIAFTGSTEVGRIIRRGTAGSGVKLSLELGGKSPFIVFQDADLDGAVEGLVDAIWFNQGEVCCAGSRLLVQENIAEGFYARLKARMAKLRAGDPLDKGIDLGALVDRSQWERVDGWVKQGVAEGADLFQPQIDLPAVGCFYLPTLLTGLAPSAVVMQEEIFGPVLVSMTFRTPAEAVALANNTRYGLAASLWTENINLALEVATQIKAGTVWINSTNLFDAAAGFGGYRESGFGREGGREGLFEYLRPAWEARHKLAAGEAHPAQVAAEGQWGRRTPGGPQPLRLEAAPFGGIDRTTKLYIGGKQTRPDGEVNYAIRGHDGALLAQVGDANRKDVRNAVEAAHKAKGWAERTPHARAQILYYIAENLSIRAEEFAARLVTMLGCGQAEAREEVDLSVERLFTYAAYADKWGGAIQETTLYGLVTALHESVGVIGILCPDEAPLLSFVSLLGPAICRGNTVVIVPSEAHPLAATDFYQILETSDLPGGVVNILTGGRDHLALTLAEHDDVDTVWYFGDAVGSGQVEYRSAANMKRTWCSYGKSINWRSPHQGQGAHFLRQAVQVKNIWVPMGV